MTIHCLIRTEGDALIANISGGLRLADVGSVRTALLKCLAEQPEALLLDLAGLTVEQELALTVFPAVQRQAMRWPGIPMLLCRPTSQTRGMLGSAAYQRLPVFADLDSAHRHLGDRRRTLPSIREQLLPVFGAARHARDVTTDACLRWDLPDLVAPACLIVSEFTGNVIDHAHTMMDLRLSLHRRHLNISLRDGSAEQPVRPGQVPAEAMSGRGLMLVDATAQAWGCLPTKDGKVMWAALAR